MVSGHYLSPDVGCRMWLYQQCIKAHRASRVAPRHHRLFSGALHRPFSRQRRRCSPSGFNFRLSKFSAACHDWGLNRRRRACASADVYFGFPRWTISVAALTCVLTGMWSGYAVALCQGMAWFKRLAIIGLVAVAMRVAFGWAMTKRFSAAEVAVSATTFSLLANLVLFYWRKDIFKRGQQVSPWDKEFRTFMIVAACVIGGTFFFQADQLIAQKYFTGEQTGAYAAAGRLSQALIMVVAPLLTVLYTSRSGHKTGNALTDQKILLALYGVGLIVARLAFCFCATSSSGC